MFVLMHTRETGQMGYRGDIINKKVHNVHKKMHCNYISDRDDHHDAGHCHTKCTQNYTYVLHLTSIFRLQLDHRHHGLYVDTIMCVSLA